MRKYTTKKKWRIICDDVEVALAKLWNVAANLVLLDPPYNFDQAYDSCNDNRSFADYIMWTKRWLELAIAACHPQGSLFIFAPDEWCTEIDMLAKHELGLHQRAHITWAFTFGVNRRKNFARSQCHILYYVKDPKNFTFNEDAIRVTSARQAIYNDKRQHPKGKIPDSVWILFKEEMERYLGKGDMTTWLQSRICGNFHERQAHSPNQIPLPIWERIIQVATNPGDLVLDPMAGTFGSGQAALRLNRRYIGIDISKKCCKEGKRRLELF